LRRVSPFLHRCCERDSITRRLRRSGKPSGRCHKGGRVSDTLRLVKAQLQIIPEISFSQFSTHLVPSPTAQVDRPRLTLHHASARSIARCAVALRRWRAAARPSRDHASCKIGGQDAEWLRLPDISTPSLPFAHRQDRRRDLIAFGRALWQRRSVQDYLCRHKPRPARHRPQTVSRNRGLAARLGLVSTRSKRKTSCTPDRCSRFNCVASIWYQSAMHKAPLVR
jgi:hypothetical protein